MRRQLARGVGVVGALVALSFATAASADNAKKKQLELGDSRAKLVVAHDGSGHYVAHDPVTRKNASKVRIFYGDGKTFYLQKTFGLSANWKKRTWSRRLWSPSSPHGARVSFEPEGNYRISCNPKKETPFTELSAAETRALLKKAKFLPRKWNRTIHVLARDEDANYYLLDAQPRPNRRDLDFSLTDVSAYRGPSGRLKKLKIKEVASDAQGIVVVTSAGSLLINRAKDGSKTATWKTPKKRRRASARIVLSVLSLFDNSHLVHTTLGVYPIALGTPCDDLYP